jgi:rubrerythrin
MSLYDDVDREARADWLNQRDALRADEMPDLSEYNEDPFGGCPQCGAELPDEDPECPECGWPTP